MATKHTKRELFETLLVFASAAEAEDWVLDGLRHELDLLNKRSASKSVDVKRKAEQDAIKERIIAVLGTANAPMRANEIAKTLDVSVQRVTALNKQMVAEGIIVRREDKKVATFSLT